MDNSDYSVSRVETPANLFGVEPAQPGQERNRRPKNPERRPKNAADQPDEPADAQAGSEDPTVDREDPHTVDYRA